MLSGNPRALSARWIVALARCGREVLSEAVDPVRTRFEVVSLQLPDSGLYLTQLEDEAFWGQAQPGQEAMSGAAVLLRRKSGDEEYRGGAIVMEQDVELAELMAICDAVVRYKLDGWERVAQLAAEGTLMIMDDERRREAGHSGPERRVDLSALESDGDVDDGGLIAGDDE